MGERLEDLMKSVLEDIKNQEYKQAYLFFGEEGYLKKQYRNKLLQAWNPDGDTMNESRFEGKGIDVKEVISLGETMPFFSDRRIILLENTGFFKNQCPELAEYLNNLPDYLYLLFVEDEVDKRSKMFKSVKQNTDALGAWYHETGGKTDHSERYGAFSVENWYGYE